MADIIDPFKDQVSDPFAKKETGIPGVLDVAGGVAETIAGAAIGMGEAAITGLAGLGTMTTGKGFEKGFETAKKVIDPFSKLVEPETRTGKAGLELLSKIPEAFHKAGEKTFESVSKTPFKSAAPTLGAGVEAALTGVSFLLGKPATKLAEKVGPLFGPKAKVQDPGSIEWTKDVKWEPPKEVNGVPVKVGEVGRTRADGSKVAATHVRNTDGTPKEIILDMEQIHSDFTDKPWTKPKLQGVEALPENSFRTPDELAYFYLSHEVEHSKQSFDAFHKQQIEQQGLLPKSAKQLRGEYEDAMNKRALENVRSNPLYRHPDSMVPPTPKNPLELRDSLYTLEKSPLHDRSLANKRWEAGRDAGITPEMKERFRASSEGDETVKLTEQEKLLYEQFYKDELETHKALLEYGQREGIIEKVPAEEAMFPRQMLPMTDEVVARLQAEGIIPKPTLMERIKGGVAKVAEGDMGGFDPNITKKVGAAETRSIFVAEDSRGKRIVVQLEGDKVVAWENNKPRIVAKTAKGDELKPGSKFGQYTLKEGKVAEIEANSPFKYNKDSQAVLYHKLTELREQIRAHEFLKNFKESDYFKENSHKVDPSKPIPEGYTVPKYLDKVPTLAGYAFPKRIAAIIEDFARVRTPTMLTQLSGILVKNMMLIPIAHMWNEGMHLWTTRGVSGWITSRGLGQFAKTMTPAVSEVINQGKLYREVIKEGGSLLSTDLHNSHVQDALFGRALRDVSSKPEWQQLAKKIGRSPLDLYNGVSKASSTAMWLTRDMMYMQQIMEKKRLGLSTKEAVAATEKHMPNYRLPSHVLEKVPGTSIDLLGENHARKLSEVLGNPNLSIFSRYHHGYLSSLANVLVEASGKGPQGKAGIVHGIDQALAFGVTLAVLYPFADDILSAITGNPAAHQRRAGGYHLFDAVGKVMNGDKDPQAVLNAIWTMNPALNALVELGFNHKLYNGQPIYTTQAGPEVMLKQIGEYLVTRIPQVNAYERETAVKTGGGFEKWAMEQALDAKLPTAERVKRDKEYLRKQRMKAEKKRKELKID